MQPSPNGCSHTGSHFALNSCFALLLAYIEGIRYSLHRVHIWKYWVFWLFGKMPSKLSSRTHCSLRVLYSAGAFNFIKISWISREKMASSRAYRVWNRTLWLLFPRSLIAICMISHNYVRIERLCCLWCCVGKTIGRSTSHARKNQRKLSFDMLWLVSIV